MADDHDPSNDVNENNDGRDLDYEDMITTAPVTTPSVAQNTIAPPADDDYDDEPIEDYVVKLVVNEKPDGSLPPGFVDAAVADSYGSTVYNSINTVTTAVYDELNGSTTAISGSKGWFGWSTMKLILAGLIALCILGIILAAIFFLVTKNRNKNQRTTTTSSGSTATTKAAVNKGVSPDPKYQPVPNV